MNAFESVRLKPEPMPPLVRALLYPENSPAVRAEVGPDRRACCNDLSDMVRAGKSVLPEDAGACGNVGREA